MRPSIPFQGRPDGEGCIRTFGVKMGGLTEAIIKTVPDYRIEYSISHGLFPVSAYHCFIDFNRLGNGSIRVEWWSEFTPSIGLPSAAVDFLLKTIYTEGLASLQKHLDEKRAALAAAASGSSRL